MKKMSYSVVTIAVPADGTCWMAWFTAKTNTVMTKTRALIQYKDILLQV